MEPRVRTVLVLIVPAKQLIDTLPPFDSTEDWSLGEEGGTTAEAIQANFQTWLTG